MKREVEWRFDAHDNERWTAAVGGVRLACNATCNGTVYPSVAIGASYNTVSDGPPVKDDELCKAMALQLAEPFLRAFEHARRTRRKLIVKHADAEYVAILRKARLL